MEQKYIKINNASEFIPVKDIYSFMYENGTGKTVLRITFDAATKSFDQLLQLLGTGADQVITSYEAVVQDNAENDNTEAVYNILDEYKHFCLDYKCNFGNNEYFVEITKKSDVAIMVDENMNSTLDVYEALVAVYEGTLA